MAARVSAMEAVGPEEAIPTMMASFKPMALARNRPRCSGASGGRAAPSAPVGVSSISWPPRPLQGQKAYSVVLHPRPLVKAADRRSERSEQGPDAAGGVAHVGKYRLPSGLRVPGLQGDVDPGVLPKTPDR